MEKDMDYGCMNIRGSESYLVELPTLDDREKRAQQFKRALRALNLKPYSHPSQLMSKVSATSPPKDASHKESKKDEKTVKINKTHGEMMQESF